MQPPPISQDEIDAKIARHLGLPHTPLLAAQWGEEIGVLHHRASGRQIRQLGEGYGCSELCGALRSAHEVPQQRLRVDRLSKMLVKSCLEALRPISLLPPSRDRD